LARVRVMRLGYRALSAVDLPSIALGVTESRYTNRTAG
jgi:hypothetical protein